MPVAVLPSVASRRDAIIATVEAHNRAHPTAPLPRPAARLLAVMFAAGDACCMSQEAMAAEGFSRKTLPGRLRALVEAGIVSREAGTSRIPNTYRLQLRLEARP